MNVTLKPELEKLIENELKERRSENVDDFLNKAVYHYVLARDLGEAHTPDSLDHMIADGLEDIERGDTIAGELAFQKLRERAQEIGGQRA